MTVDVKVNYTSKTVEQVGLPNFGIFETDRIYDVDEPGDARGTDVGNQKSFGEAEWRVIVDNNGQFSAIDFPLKTDSPVAGYEKFVRQVRADRIPISLLK